MMTISRLLKIVGDATGKLTDRLQLLHLEQLGLRLGARCRLGLDAAVQIGVDLLQLCCPLGHPLIQLLVGHVQLFVGRLQFLGRHGSFLQCRPQLTGRILVPQCSRPPDAATSAECCRVPASASR